MKTLGSWIEPEFEWTASEATFACRVQDDGPELVKLFSTGSILAGVGPRLRAFYDGHTLQEACFEWLSGVDTGHFYLHDIFQLSDGEMLVLLGVTPSSGALQSGRLSLQRQAEDRMRRYDEERSRHATPNDSNLPEEVKNICRRTDAYLLPATTVVPPRLADLQFKPDLAVLVSPLPESLPARVEAIVAALRVSGRPPARDGVYRCSQVLLEDRTQAAFVRWNERDWRTPALEIKAAVECCFESALKKPRGRDHNPPPQFQSAEGVRIVSRGEIEKSLDLPGLAERLDSFPPLAPEGKESFKRYGFEAIAWYQSFHCYDDSAWGLHFDAPKLDAFAACLAQDLIGEPRRHDLACQLALRLTAAHELFHARIDFAAAWLEVASRDQRYLPYFENVYTKLRFTSEWLEEALANWSAHCWLRDNLDDLRDKHLIQNPTFVQDLVKDWLTFSPEGYNAWRQGEKPEAWDRLASELTRGIPFADDSASPGLPLSGLIHDSNVFDLRLEDVPVYFVGQGLIAAAFFSAPCRREVHRVLKHFNYHLLTGRGKGSHELWEGPDGRAFTIPARDPLSVGVFRSLLDHFGWSKPLYMQQIRALI